MFNFTSDVNKTIYEDFLKTNWNLVSIDCYLSHRQMTSGHLLNLTELVMRITDHTRDIFPHLKSFPQKIKNNGQGCFFFLKLLLLFFFL